MADERVAENAQNANESDRQVDAAAAGRTEHLDGLRPSAVSARRAALVARRNRLSASKRALLDKRLQGEGAAEVITVPQIPRRDDSAPPPLSFAQERLWFLDQLNPNNSSYNIPTAARVSGPIKLDVLERALNEVLRRHEVLRTTFQAEQGKPFQVIQPSGGREIRVEDVGQVAESRRMALARQRATEEASQPFDLEQGPLLRAMVLRLGEEDHVVLLTVHHIVFDGWSAAIFLRELAATYAAFSRDAPSPLVDLPIQYADYAVWQRDWLSGEVLEQQLSYWRDQLADVPTLDLPTDRRRPDAPSLRGDRHRFRLPRELSRGLQELSDQEEATLFMAMLAGFQALLARYSGQDDVVVGSPIAGRQRPELESLIGFFVNTLVLRTSLSGDPSFRELLRRVREVCLTAYAHQDVPFEKLVQELQPERTASLSPLFQVLFVFQNTPPTTAHVPGRLRMQRIGQERSTAKFDLELTASATDDDIGCVLSYAVDLFDAGTIERMAGHFATLLEGAIQSPDVPISQLPLLAAQERQTILFDWNQSVSARRPPYVQDLVAAQVNRSPESTAVVFGDREMSYAELNQKANRLAHRLQAQGVGPDVKVGICLERSIDMIVGLLGTLKAGGAYVPIDPTAPTDRLQTVLESIDVLLTGKGGPAETAPARIVDINEHTVVDDSADEPVEIDVDPDNLVYVLYTSGSTGVPKGIEMTHRCASNLMTWQLQNSNTATKTLQFASFSFDVSFQEIFSTLAAGGTLVLVDEATRRDPVRLLQLIEDQSVERLYVPFVALHHLAVAAADQGWPARLREVITAGEQLRITPEVQSACGGRSLQNQYGPTETHVVTSHVLDGAPEAWPALPPIGRPITNASCYILDEWMNPVPVGLPGELYIGGEPLARGYAGQPRETGERFVPNPFSEQAGERLYKTGDVCCWRVNGEIEFLGRTDHQVKIRGFRVEPAEIEAKLGRHPQIRATVVVAREDQPGDRRLVAYVVPAGDTPPSVSELRGYLKASLPDYMIPVSYVMLDELPLSANGKVDRLALPQPEESRPEIETEYVPPGTDIEQQLAGIWAAVLGIERVGVHDNFFELGGYSLLATEVAFRIRQVVGTSLPVATLFNAPTISQLAQLLECDGGIEEANCVVPLHAKGDELAVFCVQPAGADVTPYQQLADALAPEHPVYGVSDVPGAKRDFETLDEMGADFAQVILEHQPRGPYCILGWSAGAALAVSTAAALEREERRVALVGILDGGLRTRAGELNPIEAFDLHLKTDYFLPNTFDAMPKDRRREFLDHMKRLSLREQFDWLVEWAREHGREILPPTVSWESIETDVRNTEMHLRLFNGYSPPVIRAPLYVWWAEQNLGNRRSVRWDRYTRGTVTTSQVPGDHVTFLKHPAVDVIASQLQEALRASQTS